MPGSFHLTRLIHGHFAGILPRLFSSVILIAIVAAAFYFGFPWLELLILGTVFAMLVEWYYIVQNHPKTATMQGKIVWLGLGVAVLALLAASLLGLAVTSKQNLLWLILLISATDIGAFFAGRAVGGPKLCPKISPNKTWAGLVGGMALAALVNVVFCFYWGQISVFGVVLAGAIALMAQLGDLAESWLKRNFARKDSGAWIPGHGGILDRADGLLLVMPVMYGLSLALNAPPLAWALIWDWSKIWGSP